MHIIGDDWSVLHRQACETQSNIEYSSHKVKREHRSVHQVRLNKTSLELAVLKLVKASFRTPSRLRVTTVPTAGSLYMRWRPAPSELLRRGPSSTGMFTTSIAEFPPCLRSRDEVKGGSNAIALSLRF